MRQPVPSTILPRGWREVCVFFEEEKEKKMLGGAFSSASMFRETRAVVNQPSGVRGEVKKGLEEAEGEGRTGFCG